MARQKKREEIESLSWEFKGSIDEAISLLQEKKEQYPNAVLSWEERGYDNHPRIWLFNVRDETDEEMNEREAKEKASIESHEAWERENFERLKKKYGA